MQLSLHPEGMAVRAVSSAADVEREVREYRPALLLLVDDLPGTRAPDLLATLSLEPRTGAIVLVARHSPAHVVAALNAGADDCLPLPIHPDELVARMRSIMRRRLEHRVAPVVRTGDVSIDLERRLVERNGVQLRLSRTEWEVLACIASAMGACVPTDEILLSVWGEDAHGENARLRGWVSRIRRRLGADAWSPGPIRKVAGGYAVDLDWHPPRRGAVAVA